MGNRSPGPPGRWRGQNPPLEPQWPAGGKHPPSSTTTTEPPPPPWGSLANLCSSACGTPTQVPLVEPKWGGVKGEKKRPNPTHRTFSEYAVGPTPPWGRGASCQPVLRRASPPNLSLLARSWLPHRSWRWPEYLVAGCVCVCTLFSEISL